MFHRNANNPTRAEYIQLILDLNLETLSDLKKDGKETLSIDEVIRLLKQYRKEFVTWQFADDTELEALMKFYDPKLAPKKPGLAKGGKRETKQNNSFTIFRKKYPKSKKYHDYETCCTENNIPQKERYKDEESFIDRLKREKKESEINFTLIPDIKA